MLGAGFKPVGELHSQPFNSAFVASPPSLLRGRTACGPLWLWAVCFAVCAVLLLMHKHFSCAKAKSMCALFSQKLNRSDGSRVPLLSPSLQVPGVAGVP